MDRRGIWTLVGVGVLLSLLLAGVVSFYASSEPDGLNKVAEDHGFAANAADSANASIPTAGYAISGISDERLSGGLAGVLGVVVVLVIAFGVFWLLARGRKDGAADAATGAGARP
jgi:hypothetical protein